MTLPADFVDIEQVRARLSDLCNFVWDKRMPPGGHLWSIPADPNRDFDILISRALDELESRRAAMSAADMKFPGEAK